MPPKIKCVPHPEIVSAQEEADLDFLLYGGPPSDPLELELIPAKVHKIRGRTPLYVKYPTMVPLVDHFLKLHGYGAHDRRRSESFYSSGVSLADIRRYLFKEIPQLRKDGVVLSHSTIHHLLVCPRKNSSSAYKYKGEVDGKLSRKRADFNAVKHIKLLVI